jgi:ABC-type glycerol-3-phosphate transport system permease component
VVQLLKIEWLKIKNYTAFIVISLFFVLGIVAANYMVYSFKKNVIDKADPIGLISSTSPYDFANVWQTTSYVSGCLLILPGLIIIMLVTNEFTFKTHRQNIIDGWSRNQFIQVKLAMALIVALVSTVLVVLTALIFGFALGSTFGVNHIEALGFFFLKALTYNLIAVLIGVLVRKTGFAIGIFFVYTCLENFISLLLEMLAIKIKTNYNVDTGNLGDYLPMNAADGLLYFPKTSLSKITSGLLPTDYMYLVLAFTIAYIFIFIYWSKNRMETTDL